VSGTASNSGRIDGVNMTDSLWTVGQVNYQTGHMLSEKKALTALGTQIKAVRKAQGLTQEQLAEACEFDPTYVSLLERGLRNPPFLTLYKIAEQLECSMKRFFEGID